MNFEAVWTETEESRLKREDEVRMQELRRLFDLMDEREEAEQVAEAKLEQTLRVLSWRDLESFDICPGLGNLQRRRRLDPIDLASIDSHLVDVDCIDEHRQWLKAFRSAMSYLAKVLLVTDSSLLIKLRCTLEQYAEISYPNLLVVIQPKLQTLNSRKA